MLDHSVHGRLEGSLNIRKKRIREARPDGSFTIADYAEDNMTYSVDAHDVALFPAEGAPHKPGELVLALYPMGAEWTTVFYPAFVLRMERHAVATPRLVLRYTGDAAQYAVPPRVVLRPPADARAD
eukprot:gnl/Chilomastix_cuspidata/679.p2 GENE.gnl/Chilomastix_cuspidata/679~~gnl/Chilomastix_cuspidata/679.p2  ORF type:complete len:126 (-),score=0.73 gnl/Chilomastix_cuspidata/679:138-515(-)